MWSGRAVRLGAAVGAVAGSIAVFDTIYKEGRFEPSSFGVVRFGRAAATVSRIAVDYKWSLHGLDRSTQEYDEEKSKTHLRSANKLLALCSANGGVFIKVGQHMGALDYLLPEEYVRTLRVLHSRAPKSQFSDVLSVLKEDLGKEPLEVFSTLEEEPIGAASLAQVHKATLPDGKVVAVKVQHRNVLDHSVVDIRTMEILVRLVARLFPEFCFLWLAEETKRNLPLELDFVHEGRNAERVRRMFAKFPWLKVPGVHWDMTTKRVLTMEFCEGGEIHDKNYMIRHHISPAKISQRLGELYSEMIFVQGYVHCDPHPGNILVQSTPRYGDCNIVLLDHGLYQTLTDIFRLRYCRMWKCLIDADMVGLKKVGLELGVGDLYGLLACIVSGRSWQSVSSGIDKDRASDSERNHIRNFAAGHLPDISELLNRVPREMLLLFKTNDLLRGIESTIGVHGAASSFVTMSRCCVEAISQQQMLECRSLACRLRIRVSRSWALFKISFYRFSSWLRNSFFSRWSFWNLFQRL